MADSLIQALMVHLHAQDPFPSGVKVLLVLDNGRVLRGLVVSPDDFMVINWHVDDPSTEKDTRDAVLARVNPRSTADGSWPPGFTFPLAQIDCPSNYVHLVDVEICGCDGWVESSSTRINTNNIIACGDQWH
jgi:hypothetical protein